MPAPVTSDESGHIPDTFRTRSPETNDTVVSYLMGVFWERTLPFSSRIPSTMRECLRRSAILTLIAATLILSGCDTDSLGGDSVFLTTTISDDVDGDDVIFQFSSGDIQEGRLVDLSCGCTLDIDAYLNDQGFTKAQLVSATVQSVRVVMLFPTSEQLDFLDEAILKLGRPGASATEVANISSLPSAREVNLQTLSNRDIVSFLDSPGFEPILQINAGNLTDGEDYELSVILTVRMELEGV